MRKKNILLLAIPIIVLVIGFVYIARGAADSPDYGNYSKTAERGQACPWMQLDREAMSERERQTFDIYYSALAESGCAPSLCDEIARFYAYYYAGSAVSPSIIDLKITDDRVFIQSEGNLFFSFFGSDSILAIHDINADKVIYGVEE